MKKTSPSPALLELTKEITAYFSAETSDAKATIATRRPGQAPPDQAPQPSPPGGSHGSTQPSEDDHDVPVRGREAGPDVASAASPIPATTDGPDAMCGQQKAYPAGTEYLMTRLGILSRSMPRKPSSLPPSPHGPGGSATRPATACPEPAIGCEIPGPVRFILASGQAACRLAVQGSILINTARAHCILTKMPDTIDLGPDPDDAIVVLLDLDLSTWGGALKTAGYIRLFQSAAARDFWSLAAHVDTFGIACLAQWNPTRTVARYRAVMAWWIQHRPVWSGEDGMSVQTMVHDLTYVLTVMLCNEDGLRAFARSTGGRIDVPTMKRYRADLLASSSDVILLNYDSFFLDRETGRNDEILVEVAIRSKMIR